MTVPEHCTQWIDDDHLCALARHHSGKCLPLPRRWAVKDISADNPRWRALPTAAHVSSEEQL